MAQRTIKAAYFRYRVPWLQDGEQVLDEKGKPVYLEQTARQNETVEIPLADDVALGEKHGLFVTDSPDLSQMSAAQLRRWLTEEAPTVAEIVAAVGDDAGLAKRVSDAEAKASKGEPRVSLLEQLDKVGGAG